jgi:hypothetical protein
MAMTFMIGALAVQLLDRPPVRHADQSAVHHPAHGRAVARVPGDVLADQRVIVLPGDQRGDSRRDADRGRAQTVWRVVLLLLLCAAAVTIRWAGLINMVLIVAVLLDKQWRPRLTTTLGGVAARRNRHHHFVLRVA